MSFECMGWAVKQKLPAAQKIVLLMLANRTNHDTGRCDPSISCLANDCGLSVRATRNAIRQLEEMGLISTRQRKVGKVNSANSYILNLTVFVGEFGTAPDAGGTAPDAGGTAGDAGGVRQEVPTKQEIQPGSKPPLTPQGGNRFDPMANLPDAINRSAWREWIEYRQAGRKKLSELAVRKQITLLSKHDHADQQSMVDKSIANDWQGLFAPDPAKPATKPYAVSGLDMRGMV